MTQATEARQSLRARYVAFIDSHDTTWELTFAALAIVFVGLGFVPDDELPAAAALEWTLTAVFAVEFFSRLWAAASRRAYLADHWIDLAALVPPTRGLRVLRLLRLLRLVRIFAGGARAIGDLKRLAEHRGLVWLVAGWLGVVAFTSIGMYAVEHGANPELATPWDGLWWGLSTMTGAGYGDIVPATPEGRIVAIVLMLLGVALFSAVTAMVTSFLVHDDKARAANLHPLVAIGHLAELHKAGCITEAQFHAKRDELLERV